MSDNYSLSIDSSGAESGAERIEKSFEKIQNAALAMEKNSVKAMSSMAKAMKEMSNYRGGVDKIGEDLRKLSAALNGVASPSKAAVSNITSLLRGLKELGSFKVASAGPIASLLGVLSGYKGPSQAAAANTNKFLKSIQGFDGGGRVTSSLRDFISVMSGYKGPTKTSTSNTIAFLKALGSFVPPRGVSAAITQFKELAAAIERAATSIRTINSGVSGGGRGFGPNPRDIEGYRNLNNQQGIFYNSLVRTQTVLNSLGGILGVKFIANASTAILKINAQLEAATGSTAQARVQFEFLRSETNKLGLDFVETSKAYGLLLGSVKGTSLTFAETQDLFRGFSTASRALQLSADDVGGVFRALGQIMSKGKLQAEELRGQLGDRLPGAFTRFAVALKMTKPGELDDALKKGAISGELLKNAILDVARTMELEFAETAKKSSQTVEAAFNRLKNSFTFEAAEFGANGFNAALISLFDTTQKFLESDTLSKFLKGLAVALKLVGENIELIATLMVSGLIAKFALAFAPTAALGSSLVGLANIMKAMPVVALALATGNLSKAWAVLNMVMKANPFIFLATAIATAAGLIAAFTSKVGENTQALVDQGNTSSTAGNLMDFFSKKVQENSTVMDENSAKIRQNYQERLRLVNAELSSSDFNLRRNQIGGPRGAKGKYGSAGDPIYSTGNWFSRNETFMGQDAKDIDTLRGGFSAEDKRSVIKFVQAYERLGSLKASSGVDGKYASEEIGKILLSAGGRISEAESNPLFREKFNMKLYLDRLYPGRGGAENQNLLGNGDAEPKASAADKKAAREADQFAQAIRKITEEFKQMDRAIAGNASAVDDLLGGGMTTQAAKARDAAREAVASIEAGFDTQKEAQKGILATASALGLQAKDYETAKRAVTSYYEAKSLLQAQTEVDRGFAEGTAQLRQENEIRANILDHAGKSTAQYERAVKLAEIELELVNATDEKRQELLKTRTEELDIELKRNRVIEASRQMAANELQGQKYAGYSGLYGKGYSDTELEFAKSLNDRKIDLYDKGYGDDEVQSMLDQEKALFRLAEADRQLQKEYEKRRDLSVDLADAIVGGFKEGIEEGQKFKDVFKNIFSSIEKILLEFVLYNPLRDFLRQSLTMPDYNTPGTASRTKTQSADLFAATSAGLNLLSNTAQMYGDGTTTGSGGTQKVKKDTKDSVFDALNQDIIVNGRKSAQMNADATVQAQKQSGIFGPLKSLFNYKDNIFNNGKLKEIKNTVISKDASLKDKLGALGDGVAGVAEAGMKAYAAYKTGSAVAGMLGLGKVGKGVMGGAAAGFTLAGPIGAAVGAVIGGVAGFLKKNPSSFANVVVGSDGQASISSSGKTGKGKTAVAEAFANAGIAVFEDFAAQYGSSLTPGSYGTFGTYKKDSFYSTLGRTKKGKPLGREGVDYIKGSDAELQGFALKKQIQAGKFAGLDPVYQTIAKNSSSNDIAAVQQDMQVGTNYLDFIESSFKKTDIETQIKTLEKNFKLLSAQSKSLGLDTNRLSGAYAKILKQIKTDFDYEINQELLGYSDPLMQSWNELIKEYEDVVASGQAAGGDLLKVEELFGKKRTELLEEFLTQSTDAVKQAGQEMLRSLTATSSSPLSAGVVFGNSQSQFNALASQYSSGDYSQSDKFDSIINEYLNSAQNMYGSGQGYFEIFKQVTDFLSGAGSQTTGTGGSSELPNLPSIAEILAKLEEQKTELVDSSNEVGAAIVEGNTETNDLLTKILSLLQSGAGANSILSGVNSSLISSLTSSKVL